MNNRKLTDEQAAQVRRMGHGGLAQRLIARRFGIHNSTVAKIIQGRTYKRGSP